LGDLGVRTAFIEKAGPWENGYNESFNGKLRGELLNREIFYNMAEARILVERWRRHYNHHRPHGALPQEPQPSISLADQPGHPRRPICPEPGHRLEKRPQPRQSQPRRGPPSISA
jgi:transposase InsO family protein